MLSVIKKTCLNCCVTGRFGDFFCGYARHQLSATQVGADR